MNLEQLQDALNSNRIDFRSLNDAQKMLIDKLQRKGILETKPLRQLEGEQLKAAEELAHKKRLYVDPIKEMTSDTLNRENAAIYTDLGLLFGQLLYDRKRMAKYMLNPAMIAKDIDKIAPNFRNKTLNKFTVGLKQLKQVAQRYLGGTAPATAANVASRSAITAAMGYTAGGLAYDMADEITRDLTDLQAKVGEKTYKEMSEKNQLVRSLNDLRIGLMWGAGAELLGPLMSGGAYALRKMGGLETEYSRNLARIAKSKDLPANWLMLADPNTLGGSFLKKLNRVFGQLPFIGGPARKAQEEAIASFNKISGQAFNVEPGMHLATMATASEETARAVLKNYQHFATMNKINYNRAIDMAKAYGDPMVIELNNVKSVMRALEENALAPAEIKAGFTGPERLKSPFGQFYDAYKRLAESGRKISMTEYIELRELLNRTTNMLYKNDKAVMEFSKLQKALETDFAMMNLDPATKVFLRHPVLNKTMIDASGGTAQLGMAESTVGKTQLDQAGKVEIKQAIEDAFEYYANNIKTFESITARKLAAFDQNALSLKGLQGFEKAGKVHKDAMLKTLSRNILQMKDGFSFDAIRELQQLVRSDVYQITPRINKLGGTSYDIKLTDTGTKEGNAVLERLWGAHVGDAYQKSFQLVNKFQHDDWLGSWLSKESRAGQTTGMSKQLDEMKLPNGQAADNVGKGNRYFDADSFQKLILPNEAARVQFAAVFGPEKARALLKQYDDMMNYMRMVKSYAVPDASTFLARRLVLSGPGRALAAGGMYGAGFIPTGMYLFLGNYANRILSNPNALNYINKGFKHFLEDPSRTGLDTFGRLLISRLANTMITPDTGKTYTTDDVDIMEIYEYLNDRKVPIDNLEGLYMDPKMEEQLYPKLTKEEYLNSLDTLPPPEDLVAQIGGMPANLEEEAMMKTAINQLPKNQPITPTTLPRQAGLRIPGAGVQKPDYSALFPFDPIGNLISDRREAVTPQPRNPNVQRQS